MIQFNLKNKSYILIEVPSDAYDFTLKTSGLTMDRSGYYYLSWKPDRKIQHKFSQKEPVDIVGKLSEVLQNEELSSEIVDSLQEGFGKDGMYKYKLYNDRPDVFSDKATHSFKSFLQSINVDMSKEYLLISKQ